MGYRFGLDLMGSKMTMDAIWEGFSPENENGKVPDTLEGYRTKFQDVHQQIHAIHNIADEPFGNLAVSAKSILDPMIKLMEVFLSKSEGKGNNRVS